MRNAQRWAWPAMVLLFFAAPGYGGAWFSGIPVGPWAVAILAIAGFVWWIGGHSPRAPDLTRAVAALVLLTVVKVVAGAVAPPTGWLGRYYSNDRFAGEPRRSTEFPRLAGATRIDPVIDFQDDLLPAYFLNEADFNRDIRREVVEPLTIWWTGSVHAAAASPFTVSVQSRGDAEVDLDGVLFVKAATDRPAKRDAVLAAGDHTVDVRYAKPANTDPLIRVVTNAAVVSPAPGTSFRRAALVPARAAARAVDLAAVLVIAYAIVLTVRAADWSSIRVAAAMMFGLFLLQGMLAAIPYVHRAVTLSGGDDWLAFEAGARAVATGDVFMRFGEPLGRAEPMRLYPGYMYFLAGMHALGSEDLSTIVLVQFLLLFGANVVVFRIGSRLFGPHVAAGAVAALIAIEEVAFVRHYTPTLLSENLYFFTVAALLYLFGRFVATGDRRTLVWCGVAAGVSALTRSALMLFLVPSTAIVVWLTRRQGQSWRVAASSGALFAGVWLLTMAPASLRDAVVAGVPIGKADPRFFLASINYTLPPNVDGTYYRVHSARGALPYLRFLADMMVQYPREMLQNFYLKTGFSLGLVQWMGGRAHPELALASLGYLVALLWIPEARGPATWPIHAFVFTHLLGLVLMMPSVYGYRLILPMYLFFPLFGARVVAELARRRAAWR